MDDDPRGADGGEKQLSVEEVAAADPLSGLLRMRLLPRCVFLLWHESSGAAVAAAVPAILAAVAACARSGAAVALDAARWGCSPASRGEKRCGHCAPDQVADPRSPGRSSST